MLGARDPLHGGTIGGREDGETVVLGVAGRGIPDQTDQRAIETGGHPLAEPTGVDQIEGNDAQRARVAAARNQSRQPACRESGIDHPFCVQRIGYADHIQSVAKMPSVPEPRVAEVQGHCGDSLLGECLRQIGHALLAAEETMPQDD